METSKRRQIPTMNVCANFSFRGLRKKKNVNFFRIFREYFCHTKNYFRHVSKLHTSQQQKPHTKHSNSMRTHTRLYYGRSRPGLQPNNATARGKQLESCKTSVNAAKSSKQNKTLHRKVSFWLHASLLPHISSLLPENELVMFISCIRPKHIVKALYCVQQCPFTPLSLPPSPFPYIQLLQWAWHLSPIQNDAKHFHPLSYWQSDAGDHHRWYGWYHMFQLWWCSNDQGLWHVRVVCWVVLHITLSDIASTCNIHSHCQLTSY